MEAPDIFELVPGHFTKSFPHHDLHNKLATLFSQLLDEVNIGYITATVASENSRLVVAEVGRTYKPQGIEYGEIIGAATLIIMITPHGKVGYVHDVVVDEKHRGQGIGQKLMKEIIAIAQSSNLRELNLTTNASKRPDAEALYTKLGFSQKPTGFYVLKLIP